MRRLSTAPLQNRGGQRASTVGSYVAGLRLLPPRGVNRIRTPGGLNSHRDLSTRGVTLSSRGRRAGGDA